MKFSQSKKAKIRKVNQKRINRYCKYMIGLDIYDGDNCYEVKDQAKINNTIYLLVQVGNNEYAIYKIVKLCEYAKLSDKKVLQNRKIFSNRAYWRDSSIIRINDDGKIQSVKKRNFF